VSRFEIVSGSRRLSVLIWHQPCSSRTGAGLGAAMTLAGHCRSAA
jgi:hypothetical protein